MFKKSLVALITPFKEDRVDEGALERLVAWHQTQGTHALVVSGCTGEGTSLTHQEQCQVLTRALAASQGRLPIIASTGAVTTAETIALSQAAEKAGAQGLMIMTPATIKPTQEGLLAHFQAVHSATSLPMMLYHNPGRTGGTLHNETLERMTSLTRLVAIKDSTDNLTWPLQLRRLFGDRYSLLSGEDLTCAAFLAQGGDGTVSVTANVVPHLYAQLHDAWRASDLKKVAVLRDQIFPLSQAVLCVTNPIALKYGASLMGLCQEDVRLPLTPPTQAQKESIARAFEQAGLLEVAKRHHA